MKTKTIEALEFDSKDLESVKVLESFGMTPPHARIYIAISAKVDNRAEIGSIAGVSQIQIAEYISKYSSLVDISSVPCQGAGRPSDRFKAIGNLENVLYALIKRREDFFIAGKALFNEFLGVEYDTLQVVRPSAQVTSDKGDKKGDKVKEA